MAKQKETRAKNSKAKKPSAKRKAGVHHKKKTGPPKRLEIFQKRTTMPWFLEEKLKTAYHLARSYMMAERIWTVFSPSEKVVFGNGLAGAYSEYGTIGMWQKVRGGTHLQAVIGVSVAAHLLEVEYGNAILEHFEVKPLNERSKFLEYFDKGDLVISETRCEVCWEARVVPIEWSASPMAWRFMLQLAKCSKFGRSLDSKQLDYTNDHTSAYLKNLRGRVVTLPAFPQSLKAVIVSGKNRTYRLDLPPERIHIFKTHEDGREIVMTQL